MTIATWRFWLLIYIYIYILWVLWHPHFTTCYHFFISDRIHKKTGFEYVTKSANNKNTEEWTGILNTSNPCLIIYLFLTASFTLVSIPRVYYSTLSSLVPPAQTHAQYVLMLNVQEMLSHHPDKFNHKTIGAGDCHSAEQTFTVGKKSWQTVTCQRSIMFLWDLLLNEVYLKSFCHCSEADENFQMWM